MKRFILTVSIIAVLMVSGCNGGSSGSGLGPQSITVKLSPSAASIDAGESQTFTAILTNDSSGAGVHWTATGGTLSNVTPTSATLTAPSAGTASVTADSVAEPSRTAAVSVTVDASPSIGNTPMPDAVLGKAYSAKVPFSGGVAPITWAVTSGALPGGLAIDGASGSVVGTPTVTGAFPFTLQATDSSSTPVQVSQPKNIAVRTPLVITPATAPLAAVGSAFNLALAATGGVQPYVWSVSAGALPAGLSLNPATGAISGTPSSAGSFSATIQVSDAGAPAQTATLSLGITSAPQLTISTVTLPDPTNGIAYSAAISVSGGTAPLTFSISSGALPAGLAINATTGAITGTPSITGAVNFTAHVADSSATPQTASQALSLRVNAPLTISSLGLPSAAVNVPYSTLLVASGAVNPLTWSIASGSLPVGLSLNGATGIVSGIPTAVGTTNFTLQVVDSANPSRTASHAVSIIVNSQFAVTATAPPNATVLLPYLFTPTVSGGTLPLNWTISAGALPAGLSLSAATGVIAGIPTAAGTVTFTLQVSDASTPAQTATFPTSITVNPTLSIVSTLLNNAIAGVPYIATVTAAGSVPPLNWSVSAGALPTGLTLNATTGIISGTPSGSGTSNFTLHVTDSATPARSATLATSITVNSILAITQIILPDAVSGVAYSSTLTLTGGVAPFTWSASGGALPAGLTLSSAGVLSGSPSASGIFTFTAHVSDSSVPAQTANLVQVLHVNTALSITSLVLPNATVGVPYVGALLGAGGTAPYTWAVTVGTLPSGLTLNTATGIISGSPAGTGTSNFTVQETDSSHPALTTTLAESIKTNTLLSILPITLPNAVVGALFNSTFSTSGAVGPVSWSVSAGTLPGGLSLNASTGVLSGTPLVAALGASFTVQATDSATPPRTATLAVNLTINSALTITPIVLANAIQNVPYLGTLVATGGVAPYTWAVTVGSLPAGLTLGSTTGIITGTPTATGPSSFTVQATDSSHPAQTTTFAANIATNSALTILPVNLLDSIIGLPFSAGISTSGGVGPVTFSVSAGTLPLGLSLNASTGAITGTPTGVAGVAAVTIKATDSSVPAQVQTVALNFHVNLQLSISPISLPLGLLGSAYSANLSVVGGTGPFTWSVSAGALPIGISLDPGTGILYGNPTLVLLSNFTIKVTDSGNPAQTATLALSLNITAPGVNNAIFSGNYAFLFQGFDANGPVGIAGSINANAAGSIVSGALDINRSTGAQTNVSVISGIFAVNADNRGTLTLTTSLGTQSFRIAFDAAGTLGRMIEFDASSPSVIRGNGIIKHQNSAAFSNPSITGNYAFGISGSTSSGGRSGLIGSFLTNGSGGITSGLADSNSASVVANNKAIANTSTYNITGATNGRGALTLHVAGLSSPVAGVIYVVSSNELLFLRTDTPAAGVDLLSGEILQQSGNPFAALPLVGVSVLHVDGSASSTATSAGAGLVISTGLGILAGTYDANDNGTITSNLLATGSYSIASAATGRGTISFAGNQFLFYLVNSTTGFVLDATGTEVKTGMFEGQSVLPITLTNLLGNYVEGTEGSTNQAVSFESGVLGLDVLGNLTGTTDLNASGDVLTSGNPISGLLSLVTDGRATIGSDIYYVVSPARFVRLQAKAGQTNATVLVADK
jgi:hypothetical protein